MSDELSEQTDGRAGSAVSKADYSPPLPSWTRYGLRVLLGAGFFVLCWSSWAESPTYLSLPVMIEAIDQGELHLRVETPRPLDLAAWRVGFRGANGTTHALRTLSVSAKSGAEPVVLVFGIDDPGAAQAALAAEQSGALLLRGEPRSLMSQLVAWLESE